MSYQSSDKVGPWVTPTGQTIFGDFIHEGDFAMPDETMWTGKPYDSYVPAQWLDNLSQAAAEGAEHFYNLLGDMLMIAFKAGHGHIDPNAFDVEQAQQSADFDPDTRGNLFGQVLVDILEIAWCIEWTYRNEDAPELHIFGVER